LAGSPRVLINCPTMRRMVRWVKRLTAFRIGLATGLAFALLLWMAGMRRQALVSGETKMRDIALGQPNWPERATQIGNCYRNQLEVPVLFYILIALALPLRHADLFVVLMSWGFVVTRLVHAGIFVTSNNVQHRGLAWFAGVLVLLAMWIYFALRILLLI